MTDRMSAPSGAWRFMISNSDGGQAAGLVENVLGDAKLADVVEQRRRLDRLQLAAHR